MTTYSPEFLAELRTAKANIIMGKNVQTVAYNGRRVEYGPGNLVKLEALIQEVTAQVEPSTRRRRPAGVLA